jgi:hypothetical protein
MVSLSSEIGKASLDLLLKRGEEKASFDKVQNGVRFFHKVKETASFFEWESK